MLSVCNYQRNAIKATVTAWATEWLKLKILTISNVDKDMEQPELSWLVIGRVKENRPLWRSEWQNLQE